MTARPHRAGVVLIGVMAIATAHARLAEDGATLQLSSGKEWTLVQGNLGSTRHSSLAQVTPQNVKDLRGAWASEKFLEGATSRSTPVVRDGLMFITTQTRVYALDAKTGKTVWNMNPTIKEGPTGAYITQFRHTVMKGGQIVPNTQGVSVGQGMVFVGMYGGEVLALREKTGEVVWKRQIGEDPPQRGQGVSSAVTYANGIVFAGLANGDFGLRGRIVALDAATGRELWKFFVVPGPGEPGFETWPKNSDSWKRGGGGVWLTAAVDPELGLVYYSTGNAVPQYSGEVRVGDNLFTVCLMAFDMKTGKLRWYQQIVHHDIWEADIAQPVALFDTNIGGAPRKGIAAMRADGYLFTFDRATGKPLIPIEERPVPQDKLQATHPTQPFPVGGESFLGDCEQWKKAPIPKGFVVGCTFTPASTATPNILAPGFGARVVPMSYNPQLGYFYASGSASLGWRRRAPNPYFLGPGGGRVPGMPPGYGVLAAIDARTGKIAWQKRSEVAFGMGGSMSTASGLLFNVATNGFLQAIDGKNGELLWDFPTEYASGGGPPSSYEIDGEQYVAVAAGLRILAFRLNGPIARPATPPPAPAAAAAADAGGFTGPITDVDQIETVTLLNDLGTNGGTRYFVDEFAFNPYRARVAPGTRVRWGNNGDAVHTITAVDGSWTTGPLKPSESASVVFDKAGTYAYICKDHPWSYGQLIVEMPKASAPLSATAPSAAAPAPAQALQAARGQTLYGQNCSACHGAGLEGSSGPALTGTAFLAGLSSGTVGDFVNRVRNTMPLGSPGALPEQAYLDIVAFILGSNQRGPGFELVPDAEGLKRPPAGQR